MDKIITYAVTVAIAIILYSMWESAVRRWREKKALEEAKAIDEQIIPTPEEAMKKYENYKESFSIIAKGGKYMAFRYAFMVGYHAGKEDSKHE